MRFSEGKHDLQLFLETGWAYALGQQVALPSCDHWGSGWPFRPARRALAACAAARPHPFSPSPCLQACWRGGRAAGRPESSPQSAARAIACAAASPYPFSPSLFLRTLWPAKTCEWRQSPLALQIFIPPYFENIRVMVLLQLEGACNKIINTCTHIELFRYMSAPCM
jgi:hypothetical protein